MWQSKQPFAAYFERLPAPELRLLAGASGLTWAVSLGYLRLHVEAPSSFFRQPTNLLSSRVPLFLSKFAYYFFPARTRVKGTPDNEQECEP